MKKYEADKETTEFIIDLLEQLWDEMDEFNNAVNEMNELETSLTLKYAALDSLLSHQESRSEILETLLADL